MEDATLLPYLVDELKAALQKGLASGEMLTPVQIDQKTKLFQERFGPAVLRTLDGEKRRNREAAEEA